MPLQMQAEIVAVHDRIHLVGKVALKAHLFLIPANIPLDVSGGKDGDGVEECCVHLFFCFSEAIIRSHAFLVMTSSSFFLQSHIETLFSLRTKCCPQVMR